MITGASLKTCEKKREKNIPGPKKCGFLTSAQVSFPPKTWL